MNYKETLECISQNVGKVIIGVLLVIIFADAIYHTFIFIPEEYKELEQQPALLKLAPDWIRWLIHDIGKFL